MDPTIKLVIFDLDGTLAPFDSEALYPDAATWLADHPLIAVVIASNQGGIGLRHWMESGGFGEPDKYPTEEMFWLRMAHLFPKIAPTILVCAAYQSKKSGQWAPTPEGCEGTLMWRKDWRKPAPGMLLRAMEISWCKPDETLMVGDGEEDRVAAQLAGCRFQWAWEFFGRPAPEESVL